MYSLFSPQPLAAFIAELRNTPPKSAESAPWQGAEDVIIIPRALCDQLMELPAEALKVYIYLRSLDHGQPFPTPRAEIGAGVGRRKRCISDSIKELRDKGLITVTKGKSGSIYSFPPFPPRTSEARQMTASVATASELSAPPAATAVPSLAEPEQLVAKTAKDSRVSSPSRIGESEALPPSAISQLIAVCRRPTNDLLKLLRIVIQDKAVLPDQSNGLKQDGPLAGPSPDSVFFADAPKQDPPIPPAV